MTMLDRDEMAKRLVEAGYIADARLALALSLMDFLRRPLLVEGEAGVGKTEIAYALAPLHGCRLLRLQCHEGPDASSAIYEWNYQRQLLSIKARAHGGAPAPATPRPIFPPEHP